MKVDVAVAVHGKPWQTASTLFSLIEHSGRHIDKIWFHEEPKHVNDDSVDFLLPWFSDRLVHFKPPLFLGYEKLTPQVMRKVRNDPDYRRSIRYQIPFEDTDKQFLFLCHNDTFFTGDVVGEMLQRLTNSPYAGVGMIGQCWNCPANMAGVCDGARHESFNPSYAEAIALIKRYPTTRTRPSHISLWKKVILPECRLNEFACMLDLSKCRPLVIPKGDVAPPGLFAEDTGTKFFQDMRRLGQRFLHYPDHFIHAKFSPIASGYALEAASQIDNYRRSEEQARRYCMEHYANRMRSPSPALS
jgi:hypothetical protein